MDSFLQRATRYLGALLANLYFWGGLALLALLAFGAYLFFDSVLMPSYARSGVAVTVPEVAGVPVEEARGRLKARNLQVETLRETFNPSVERGAVIEQNPLGGRSVKPGRRVYLTVNTGERPMIKVPSVVDASLREAKNRLESLGLAIGEVEEDSIPSPYENTVTRQKPAAGDSLAEGASVSLWYSGGLAEEYATVPDVTEMTVEEARRTLMERKLHAVVVRPSSEDDAGESSAAGPVPQGGAAGQEENVSRLEVVRQSREPETRVRQGFEIRLYVEGEEAEEDPEN